MARKRSAGANSTTCLQTTSCRVDPRGAPLPPPFGPRARKGQGAGCRRQRRRRGAVESKRVNAKCRVDDALPKQRHDGCCFRGRRRRPRRRGLDARARVRRRWPSEARICAAAGLRKTARCTVARRRQRASATAWRTMLTSASRRAANASLPCGRATSAQIPALASAASMRKISALSSSAARPGGVARRACQASSARSPRSNVFRAEIQLLGGIAPLFHGLGTRAQCRRGR